MPIRLNLLAEAQQLEELRRRDPVKRAIWVGALCIVAVLVWSSSLWARALAEKLRVSRIQARIDAKQGEFTNVSNNQNSLRDARSKLASLHQLATNRFLNGNLLNALQQSTVPDVHLTRLRVEQMYTPFEEVKPKTNAGRLVPGSPATVVEKITITLDAREVSSNPGAAVTQFKDAVAGDAYFQGSLGKTNEVRLKALSARETTPDGQIFLPFTLECRLPERKR